MSAKAIPTIDAIMAAAREWADEPGDPNLSKLLTLVIDLHKAATNPGPGPCNVCVGMPLPSGKPCICGGKGTEWAETQGLRELCFELEDKLAEREDGLKKLDEMNAPRVLRKLADVVEVDPAAVGTDSPDLRYVAKTIENLLPYKLCIPEIQVKEDPS